MPAPSSKVRETGEVPPSVHSGLLEEAKEWPVVKTWSLVPVLADAASGECTRRLRGTHSPFPSLRSRGPLSQTHLPRPRGLWHLGWWRTPGVRGRAPPAAGPHTGPECDAGTGTAPWSGSFHPCEGSMQTVSRGGRVRSNIFILLQGDSPKEPVNYFIWSFSGLPTPVCCPSTPSPQGKPLGPVLRAGPRGWLCRGGGDGP